MKHYIIFILLNVFFGCYGLRLPENTEDPKNPNRGPILLNAGDLEYPHLAWKVSLEGIVKVSVDIDTSGSVTNVKVLERQFNADAVYTASNEIVKVKDIVDEPTINFYKQCKYLPAMRDSIPITTTIYTGMNYHLVK